VPGGHLEFLEMIKDKKSTLTWKHLPRPYIFIIWRKKTLIGIANLVKNWLFFCQIKCRMPVHIETAIGSANSKFLFILKILTSLRGKLQIIVFNPESQLIRVAKNRY